MRVMKKINRTMIFSTRYVEEKGHIFDGYSFKEDPGLLGELCRFELQTIDKKKVLDLFNIDSSPEELEDIANILQEEDSSARLTLDPPDYKYLPTDVRRFIKKHVDSLSEKCVIKLAQYVYPNVKLKYKKIVEDPIIDGENEITYTVIGVNPLPAGKREKGKQWADFLTKHYSFGEPSTEEVCLCLHTGTDWENEYTGLHEEFSEQLSKQANKQISVILFHHENSNSVIKALDKKGAKPHEIWSEISKITPDKNEEYHVWLAKDDAPTKIYAYGDEYDSLVDKKLPINIKKLEKLPDPDIKKCIEEDKLYPFRIVIYYQGYITTYDSSKHENTFSQELFIPQSNNDTCENFTPIIHSIPGLTWEDFKGNKPARFFRITDSSIWNYFVSNEDDFTRAVNNILSNWKDKYYELVVAHEFADLNARLTQQSYLYTKPDNPPKKLADNSAKSSTDDSAESSTDDSNENINKDSAKQPDAASKSNGHAAAVSPFLFHSEQDLATKRKEEYKEKLEGTVYDFKKYKWRVLLVDDKIDNIYLTPSNLNITKEKIVKDRINHLFGEECKCDYTYLYEKKGSTSESDKYDFESAFNSISPSEDDKGHVALLCVDSIEKAKAALKNYKFDFILLDYLLDEHTDKDGKEIDRHYGYELLTDLDGTTKDGKELGAGEIVPDAIGKDCSDLTPYLHYDKGKRYIVGPDHRYFFMFISAFTTAISERLRLLGYSRSEELWHIAEGACPTNTPELFCYNLQKMMVKRIKDSGMEKLNPDEMLKLAEKIFHKAEKGKCSVRKRANENYQAILGLLYHYNRILNDVEIPRDEKLIFSIRESVLMTSFMKDHENFGGLLEHLVHLVHLTAFGTARQWSEMWEEYLYFKNQFTNLFNGRLDKTIKLVIDDQEQTITIRAALSKLYSSIEDHILELKKIN